MLFTQYIIGSRLNQLEMNFDKYIGSACCCNINLVLYGITEIDNNPIFTELQKAIAPKSNNKQHGNRLSLQTL